MPNDWTKKDERMYEAIKESAEERGDTLREAKQVAARTVNKHRRLEGRTENKRTQGTGNPNLPLEERKRDELYNLAREMHIGGRGKMSKIELLHALKGKG